MSDLVRLGTCSCCGGDVVVPRVWFSDEAPVPMCERCGAMLLNTLPVLEMTAAEDAEDEDDDTDYEEAPDRLLMMHDAGDES